MSKKAVFLQLLKTFALPMLVSVRPELAPIASSVANAMVEIELIKGSQTGKEKLEHVKNVANDAADAVNTAKGHVVVDKAALDSTIEHAVSTTIEAVNLLNKKTNAA